MDEEQQYKAYCRQIGPCPLASSTFNPRGYRGLAASNRLARHCDQDHGRELHYGEGQQKARKNFSLLEFESRKTILAFEPEVGE